MSDNQAYSRVHGVLRHIIHESYIVQLWQCVKYTRFDDDDDDSGLELEIFSLVAHPFKIAKCKIHYS